MSFLIQWFLIAAMVGAAAGPAWNSLLRDIVPKASFGRVFARRMVLGTALALALTLGGGYFVDWWQARFPDTVLYAYSCLFVVGVVLGVGGLFAVARLPEPAMKVEHKTSLLDLLKDPLNDSNFRRLLVFIGIWSFTTMPERYFLTIPLLLAIHIISGIALAGVNLASSSIALKLSPNEKAHGYMTDFLAGCQIRYRLFWGRQREGRI